MDVLQSVLADNVFHVVIQLIMLSGQYMTKLRNLEINNCPTMRLMYVFIDSVHTTSLSFMFLIYFLFNFTEKLAEQNFQVRE
jgi:hypothetical protein